MTPKFMRVRVIHLKAHTSLDPSQNSCRFSDKKNHVKNKLKSPDTSHEKHTHIFTSFYTELLFSHSSRPNPKTWAYLQHIFQSLTKNQHQKNTVSATNRLRVFEWSPNPRALVFRLEKLPPRGRWNQQPRALHSEGL